MYGKLGQLIFSIFIYSFIFILFGAPFFEELLQTFSLATVLTCLTTVPFIILDDLSIDRVHTVCFSPNLKHEWFLAFISYGTIVGTWASAGLIILDWDRPWQAWPYPCMMGAIGGAVFGLLGYAIHQTILTSPSKFHHTSPSSSSAFRVSQPKTNLLSSNTVKLYVD